MPAPRTHARRTTGTWQAVTAGSVVALTLGMSGAHAQPADTARGIEQGCPDDYGSSQYDDVDDTSVHAAAIGCLDAYGIVQGRFVVDGRHYDPAEHVTRQQMASFIARTALEVPDRHYALPDAGDEARFDDAHLISDAHERNVNRLDEAGIVEGRTDGTYGPAARVNRAQMASFVARALESVTGEELPRDTGAFPDVDGAHAPAVEKLAALGVVTGQDDGTYGPAALTTRDQMAAFLARAMDYLAEQEVLVAMSYAPRADGASATVTDVDAGSHDAHERVTFTLDGSNDIGWRVRYVDEPTAQGSGNAVEVEGDAVLEVMLIGMALPPESDEEPWNGAPLVVDGDQVVEVVDVNVYEGFHQIFIGTTGLHDFEVDRLDDPQRVYVDVLEP